MHSSIDRKTPLAAYPDDADDGFGRLGLTADLYACYREARSPDEVRGTDSSE